MIRYHSWTSPFRFFCSEGRMAMFYSHLPEKTPHSRGQAGECKPWTTKDLHRIILSPRRVRHTILQDPSGSCTRPIGSWIPPITHVVCEAQYRPQGTGLPFSNPLFEAALHMRARILFRASVWTRKQITENDLRDPSENAVHGAQDSFRRPFTLEQE